MYKIYKKKHGPYFYKNIRTKDGVKFNIAKLKRKGLLKRIGPGKGGHWEMKNGKNSILNKV